MAPQSSLRPTLVCSAGGVSVEKVDSMIEFYGTDTTLLIGGGLYRRSMIEQVKRMVSAALEGQ